MSSYRLTDPRHGLLGPLSSEAMRELVRARVLGPKVRISKDRTPFMPLEALPELARHRDEVERCSLLEPSDPDGAPTTEEHTSLLRTLVELKRKSVSGMLGVRSGEWQTLAYFERGRPVVVHSNLASELLGRFLVERGELDEEGLDLALQEMRADGNPLHETLVRLRMVGPAQMFLALREQLLLRLARPCHWAAARLDFDPDARHRGVRVDLNLDAGEAVLRAARELAVTQILARFDRRMLARARVPFTFSIESLGLPTSALGTELLLWLDGGHTVAEVVRRVAKKHGDWREPLMLVYLLHELGALEFGELRDRTPTPTRP